MPPLYVWHQLPDTLSEDEVTEKASAAHAVLERAGYRTNLDPQLFDPYAYVIARNGPPTLRHSSSPEQPPAAKPPPAPAARRPVPFFGRRRR